MNITTGHDCLFVNGECPVTTTLSERMAQKLKIKLLTFKGEWFQNINYGIPYLQEILGHKVSKGRVDTIFQEAILEEREVAEIISFNSNITGRTYSMSCKIRVSDGGIAYLNIGEVPL